MSNKLHFSQTLAAEHEKAADAFVRSQFANNDNINSVLKPQKTSAAEYNLYGRSLIRGADEKPDWQQSLSGRIATRLVSRGIFGALAFTWMGNYASRSLKNYDPSCIQNWGEFGKALTNTNSFSAHHHTPAPNVMSAVAKTFDVLAGQPIQFAARRFAPKGMEEVWAKSAVTFRPRAMFHDPITKLHASENYVSRSYGRSLGHEIVGVTADFAAASAADAFTRNVIQSIDPNVEKDWYSKDGSFSAAKFGKDWGKRLWKVVSFNQGEDWAVALPYVYFMKWHRNLINNVSPGFKIASDNPAWNASSDKLRMTRNAAGEAKLEHIGDFQAEGAWDLQARFSTYNVFTLMYRETYSKIAEGLGNYLKSDSWLPAVKMPANPIMAAVEGVGSTVRYGVKSFIKANLYMQPAVPFFWVFRVPQSKWRSSPIVVEGLDGNGVTRIPSITPNTADIVHQEFYDNKPSDISDAPWKQLVTDHKDAVNQHRSDAGWQRNNDNRFHPRRDINHQGPLYIGDHAVHDHPYHNRDPYAMRNNTSLFGKIINPFGLLSRTSGTAAWYTVAPEYNNDKWGLTKAAATLTGINTVTKDGADRTVHDKQNLRFHTMTGVRTFVDASFSYTPYMIAKAETARRVDNHQMDNAINTGIDGAISFNLAKVKKSLSDIGELLVRPQQSVADPITGANMTPDSKVAATSIERGSVVQPTHLAPRTLQ